MNDEQYLIYLLKGLDIGMNKQIVSCKDNDSAPSLYVNGYIHGVHQCIQMLEATMNLYILKKKGEIPEDMLKIPEIEQEKDS